MLRRKGFVKVAATVYLFDVYGWLKCCSFEENKIGIPAISKIFEK
jgi:hypothetical protein